MTTKVPLQSALDWQLRKQLALDSSASTRDQLTALSNDGYDIEYLIKYGADGFSDNSEYKDASDGKQGSVFASVFVPVSLVAKKLGIPEAEAMGRIASQESEIVTIQSPEGNDFVLLYGIYLKELQSANLYQ